MRDLGRELGRDFMDRAQVAVGDDGRLPLGAMPGWDVFPFERAGLRARPLTAYADARADEVRAALVAR